MTKELTTLSLATKLHAIEREIELLEEDKRLIRAGLLILLKNSGLKGIKLETGEWYVRAEKTTLSVKKGVNSEKDAWKWATDNNALKIDANTAYSILRRSLKPMPKFFIKKVTEYLTIKRPNAQEDDN